LASVEQTVHFSVILNARESKPKPGLDITGNERSYFKKRKIEDKSLT